MALCEELPVCVRGIHGCSYFLYQQEKRGRKFVQLPGNETVKTGKRVKIECGAKVVEKKGGAGKMYEKWVHTNNSRISTPGSMEDQRVSKALARGALDGANIVYRHKRGGNVANPDAEDELKNVDQVRKARKTKAKNRMLNQVSETVLFFWLSCMLL